MKQIRKYLIIKWLHLLVCRIVKDQGLPIDRTVPLSKNWAFYWESDLYKTQEKKQFGKCSTKKFRSNLNFVKSYTHRNKIISLIKLLFRTKAMNNFLIRVFVQWFKNRFWRKRMSLSSIVVLPRLSNSNQY
jgi:hypothetical protein